MLGKAARRDTGACRRTVVRLPPQLAARRN